MIHRLLLILSFFPFTARARYVTFPSPGLEYGAVQFCNWFDCPNGEYFNISMR